MFYRFITAKVSKFLVFNAIFSVLIMTCLLPVSTVPDMKGQMSFDEMH
jgi:hypothetical protein